MCMIYLPDCTVVVDWKDGAFDCNTCAYKTGNAGTFRQHLQRASHCRFRDTWSQLALPAHRTIVSTAPSTPQAAGHLGGHSNAPDAASRPMTGSSFGATPSNATRSVNAAARTAPAVGPSAPPTRWSERQLSLAADETSGKVQDGSFGNSCNQRLASSSVVPAARPAYSSNPTTWPSSPSASATGDVLIDPSLLTPVSIGATADEPANVSYRDESIVAHDEPCHLPTPNDAADANESQKRQRLADGASTPLPSLAPLASADTPSKVIDPAASQQPAAPPPLGSDDIVALRAPVGLPPFSMPGPISLLNIRQAVFAAPSDGGGGDRTTSSVGSRKRKAMSDDAISHNGLLGLSRCLPAGQERPKESEAAAASAETQGDETTGASTAWPAWLWRP